MNKNKILYSTNVSLSINPLRTTIAMDRPM